MKPNDTTRQLQQHSTMFRKVERQLTNIEQRLGFLEVKMDASNKLTTSGNGTRNLMLLVIVVKILFDGAASVDLHTLLRMIGG